MLEARDLTIAGRLDSVSAVLRPGEVTAICGPNGAGKSTLLAALAGLLGPTGGTVTLDARPLADWSTRQRAQALGYLPQTAEIAWDIDVATLAGLGRLPWRTSASEDAAAVAATLAMLDLDHLAARPVSQLSGGERARALLARVLAGQPRWILADEPLASLDHAHQAALLDRFRTLAGPVDGRGIGVLLVLHDLARARNRADRVLVLENGRLVADGAPGEALSEAVIAQIWGVQARWLGEAGSLALST